MSTSASSIRSRPRRGFTLVETTISMGVLAILMVGVLSALMLSRRMTEGSIYQNSALTIIQGYIEQMKNMEFASLPYTNSSGTVFAGTGVNAYDVPTRLDESTTDVLQISPAAIPALSGITPGVTPTGIRDNIKLIDINQTPSNTNDDLRLNIWAWVQDITDASVDATQVRAITFIYQWQNNDGSRSRPYKGTVRTIRSAVMTL